MATWRVPENVGPIAWRSLFTGLHFAGDRRLSPLTQFCYLCDQWIWGPSAKLLPQCPAVNFLQIKSRTLSWNYPSQNPFA